MARRRFRKSPGSLKAWVLTIALHLVVIGLLVIAFRWPGPSGDNTQVIDAVVVEDQQAKQRKAEAARKKAETRKKHEAEKRRKAEAARKRAEAERQRAEVKRKRVAEERKRKHAKEQKRLEEQRRLEEEKQRLVEERQRLEEEKQHLEAERQRAEAERKRKEVEEQLATAMAAEERERQEQARRARALTATEKYKALIRQKVSRNWARPPGTEEGLQCMVRVRLVPGGEVLQVKIISSSGDKAFDRSVENAVHKASPLPLPEEQELFEYFREIEFLFNPEDR